MAKRWIVVAVGKRPGIYDDWIEAQPHVHGVPGALFKGYPTLEKAEQAFEKACRAGTVKTVRMESAEGENEFRRPNPAGAREDCRQPPAPESRPRPQHDTGQTSSARPSAPKGKGKQEPEEKYQPDSRHRTQDDGTSRRPMSSGRPGEPQASSSRLDRRQAAYKEESELDYILKMMKMEDSSDDMPALRDASQCQSANRSRKSSYLSSPPTGVSQNLPSDRSSMSERGSPVSVSQRSSNSQESPVEDARNVGGSNNSATRMPRTPPAWRGQQGFTPQKRSSDIESLYMSDLPSKRPSRNAQSTSSRSTGPSGQIGLATSSSSSRKITRTESMPAATSSSPPTEVTQYGSVSLPPSPVRRTRRTATREANTQTVASPVRRTQSVQAPSIKEESLDDDEDAWMAAHGEIGADDPPVFEFASPSSSASRSACKCSSRKACPTCGRPIDTTVPATPRTRPATPVLSSLSPELSIRSIASCVSPTAARASLPTTPVASANTPSRIPLPASPRSPMASPSGRTRTPGTPLYPSLAGVSEMLGLTGLSQPMHAANVVHDAGLDPRSPFAGSTRVPMFAGRSHAFGRPTPSVMPGTLSIGGEK